MDKSEQKSFCIKLVLTPSLFTLIHFTVCHISIIKKYLFYTVVMSKIKRFTPIITVIAWRSKKDEKLQPFLRLISTLNFTLNLRESWLNG